MKSKTVELPHIIQVSDIE